MPWRTWKAMPCHPPRHACYGGLTWFRAMLAWRIKRAVNSLPTMKSPAYIATFAPKNTVFVASQDMKLRHFGSKDSVKSNASVSSLKKLKSFFKFF